MRIHRHRLFLPLLGVAGLLSACAEEPASSDPDPANASYAGIYEQPVRLSHGIFEGAPFVEGGASRPRVTLVTDFVFNSDLDGDGRDERVVLLAENSGGSGTMEYLAAISAGAGGSGDIGTVALGDRVQIVAAEAANNGLELVVLQTGPQDAACCPGDVVRRRFAYEHGALREASAQPLGRLSLDLVSDRNWVLTRLSGEPVPALETPVTLSLADGQVSGFSGCNTFRGRVTAGDGPGELNIDTLAGTRMACPDLQSGIEHRFLAALAGASGFGFQATRLVLRFEASGVSGALTFE